MNYDETTNWLFNQLPMFQQQGAIAYKNDLTNITLLSNHLNHPQEHFKSIHIAGTNGKGSTSSLLASVLQEAGYKVGLYTSPHLKDYRERIRVNGKKVSKAFVVNFVKEHKSFFESNNLSFFEMSVGLAFDYFAKMEVDVAVIEVGMGGRLDATNIITPLVSVITNIGLDHTQFLGNTLEAIAFEKAGIIKNSIPVVIGETTPETKAVFEASAQNASAPLTFAEDSALPNMTCALLGDYQKKNMRTVLATLEVLKPYFSILPKHIENGFNHVVDNTKLLGRWQILNTKPKVVCDTAHNEHGLRLVVEQLNKESFHILHIVLGVVADKDLASILTLLPKNAKYYFCSPKNNRALDPKILKAQAASFGLEGTVFYSVTSAYLSALANAKTDDFIYVGGSNFVVAEII